MNDILSKMVQEGVLDSDAASQINDASAAGKPLDEALRSAKGTSEDKILRYLADYFGIDPTLVRIGFLVLAVMGGLALPLYVAGWLLIPEEGAEFSLAEDLLSREGRLTGD